MWKKSRLISGAVRIVVACAAVMCAVGAALPEEAVLVADSMKYDPGNGIITASGNVHIANPDGEIFGDRGSGTVAGDNFEIHGNVRGNFKQEDGRIVKITCKSATLSGPNGDRVVTASGGVRLTRGEESLTAEVVVWSTGTDRYSADGNVLSSFGTYAIDADVVSRDMDRFSARTVRRFSEKRRNIVMSADSAEGAIKNEEVTEMTATGNVDVTMPDKDGVMTRATGNKVVYSVERGTMVLTGNAIVAQTGRRLRSESIVYFLDTGHIDANGSPSLTFETRQ